MGGKGGGGGRPIGEAMAEQLERQIKQELSEAAAPKRNVFISFKSEDLNEVNLLRAQAKNDNSALEFNDWSLKVPFDSERAEYIRRGIRERIRQASVTVVYLSEATASSQWVDWEIRESAKLGKGVVAVHKQGGRPSVIPTAITEHRVRVIEWTAKGLGEAIEGAAKRRDE